MQTYMDSIEEPMDEEILELHAHGKVFNDSQYYVRLAELYEEGIRVKRDLKKTVEYYKKAVNIGSREAAEGLANFYEFGAGKHHNGNHVKKIAKWWLKAAELGSQEGMLRTAINFQYGVGLPVDFSKAFEWYLKLAESGSCKGMFCLAECYFNGVGTEQNYTKAFTWYKKAAQYDRSAIKRVADCYSLGLGTKKSLKQAMWWGGAYTWALQNETPYYYE